MTRLAPPTHRSTTDILFGARAPRRTPVRSGRRDGRRTPPMSALAPLNRRSGTVLRPTEPVVRGRALWAKWDLAVTGNRQSGASDVRGDVIPHRCSAPVKEPAFVGGAGATDLLAGQCVEEEKDNADGEEGEGRWFAVGPDLVPSHKIDANSSTSVSSFSPGVRGLPSLDPLDGHGRSETYGPGPSRQRRNRSPRSQRQLQPGATVPHGRQPGQGRDRTPTCVSPLMRRRLSLVGPSERRDAECPNLRFDSWPHDLFGVEICTFDRLGPGRFSQAITRGRPAFWALIDLGFGGTSDER
jgi:hypothetical protein